MRVSRRVLANLVPALVFSTLAGCAWLPLADTPAPQRLQGLLQLTADGARLESCGGPVYALQADDQVRTVFNQVVSPGETTVFVDLTATLVGEDRLQPDTIIRMGSTGRGCVDAIRESSRWIAQGEQPAWEVQVQTGAGGMRTKVADSEPGLSTVIAEELPDGSRSFRTLDGDPVELWVYPQPCFAQRSGDYYEHTARLLNAGANLTGCAYRGMMTDAQPSSH